MRALDKIKGEPPLIEYEGIQILYLEESNKWRFELRGRERKADSLKQAKEWIDKPEPVKKASKNFERFQCYQREHIYSYSSGELRTSIVTVTSVAQDEYHRGNIPCVAWITNESGERSKVNVDVLLQITDDTKQKITEYNATVASINRLQKQNEKLLASIKRVDLSKYVDNGDEE